MVGPAFIDEVISERHRPPHIGLRLDPNEVGQLFGSRKLKFPGRDANHGVALAIERHRASDHVGFPRESSLPQRVAYDNDPACAWFFFVVTEGATKLRLNSHQPEKVRGDRRGTDSFGFTNAGHIEMANTECG